MGWLCVQAPRARLAILRALQSRLGNRARPRTKIVQGHHTFPAFHDVRSEGGVAATSGVVPLVIERVRRREGLKPCHRLQKTYNFTSYRENWWS
jgi:hypothetical protein